MTDAEREAQIRQNDKRWREHEGEKSFDPNAEFDRHDTLRLLDSARAETARYHAERVFAVAALRDIANGKKRAGNNVDALREFSRIALASIADGITPAIDGWQSAAIGFRDERNEARAQYHKAEEEIVALKAEIARLKAWVAGAPVGIRRRRPARRRHCGSGYRPGQPSPRANSTPILTAPPGTQDVLAIARAIEQAALEARAAAIEEAVEILHEHIAALARSG